MVARVQPRQLAFALPHAESLSRDNFLEGPANAEALGLIDCWPDWPNRVMMLVGPEGSGKSHLAAIWAEEAGARSTMARSLTATTVPAELVTRPVMTAGCCAARLAGNSAAAATPTKNRRRAGIMPPPQRGNVNRTNDWSWRTICSRPKLRPGTPSRTRETGRVAPA